MQKDPIKIPIPSDLVEKCTLLRQELIEKIASFDDDFLMKVLEGEEVSVEELKKLSESSNYWNIFPSFCWLGLQKQRNQLLLDGIVTIFLHH